MILSVHIARLGAAAAPGVLRARPDPDRVPGLRWAETTITAPLSAGLLPAPSLGRLGLLAAWDDDTALERFQASDPLAARFAAGWQARFEPLHVYGRWPALPGLPTEARPLDPGEPVAVLTLGRLRIARTPSFLRASAGAEAAALTDPALLASTAMTRPPGLVATFSIWREAEAMRAYAAGPGGGHAAATAAHGKKPFHHDSAFIRLRPYASAGLWEGRDPLAASPAAP